MTATAYAVTGLGATQPAEAVISKAEAIFGKAKGSRRGKAGAASPRR